jgi:predicted MPP superfamily phosphohydrolase
MQTRRALLGLTATVAASAVWATSVEPEWHEVTVTPILGLPALRILHFSDLHCSDGLPASALLRALEMGLEHRPDVICLTGDYVSTTHGFDETGLRGIFRRAAQAAPTYAVLGNHDGGYWLNARFGGSPTSAGMRQILGRTGRPLPQPRRERPDQRLPLGTHAQRVHPRWPSPPLARACHLGPGRR